MFAINNLTAQPNQTSNVILADGTTVTLTFIYRPATQRWTVDVAYQEFALKSYGLAVGPNILRKWRNSIPFGLQVTTADQTDPFLATDLDASSGTPRVTVTMLDSTAGNTDVQNVEAQFFSAGSPAAY